MNLSKHRRKLAQVQDELHDLYAEASTRELTQALQRVQDEMRSTMDLYDLLIGKHLSANYPGVVRLLVDEDDGI